MIDVILLVGTPVLVPALILPFVSAEGRRFFLLFGLLVGLVSTLIVGSGGGHNPFALIPVLGFGVAVGALIAELAVFLWRRRKAATKVTQ